MKTILATAGIIIDQSFKWGLIYFTFWQAVYLLSEINSLLTIGKP